MKFRRTLTRSLVALIAVVAAAGASAQEADRTAVLNLATNADPTLNPWTPGAVIESNLINTILFEQLTRYSPEDLTPVPMLATSWRAEDGGLSWVFELRQDARWSDGEPFTAEDVAFTFNDVVLNPALGAQSASQFSSIDHVEVIDDYTVRFVLNSPFSALPYYLASFAGIIPEHVLGSAENPLQVAEFNKGIPVTTGPYKVAEFVPGAYVRLVPNEYYYEGEPKLAGIVFRIIPDLNTQVAEAMAGQLDVVTRLSPQNVRGIESTGALEVLRQSQNLFFFVAPNFGDERLQDVRVRRALTLALDREAMIQALLDGYGEVASGPVAPMLGALFNGDVMKYPYDPEAAKALLEEAGWTVGPDGIRVKDGQRLSFRMPTGQYGDLVPATLLAQQFWQDIGVEVDVQVIEWNAYIQEVILNRNYELSLAWWSMPPTADVAPYFACSAANTGNNIPNYCNPEVDAIMDEGRAALTLDDQVDAYRRMQEKLAEDLAYIYLWWPDILTAKSVRLQGFPEITASTAFQHSFDWYIAK